MTKSSRGVYQFVIVAVAMIAPSSFFATGIVTKLSPWPVEDTVARMTAVVREKGMTLFAVIDHSGEAKATGMELRETKVVMFGNPRAGTPVMQSVPLAALDLPLKVLVWADGDQTKLSYTAPDEFAARYGLSTELGARLAGIEELTDEVLRPPEHVNREN